MERCLDCNSMLAREETVCMECGTKVGADGVDAADFGVTLLTMAFYASIVALVASPFMSKGPGFMLCLLVSFALLFIMRTAKDSAEKIRKR